MRMHTTLTIPGDSPLVTQLMDCEHTPIRVTVEGGDSRTPFYVDRFDYNYRDGQWSGTAHLRTMFGGHGLENPED